MRIIAGLFLALLVLAGCSDKDKVPSGIIQKEKMESLVWDMIQADQYAAIYLAKDSNRINVKNEQLKLYQQVFQLHQVSRDEFRKSFQFYLDRPDITRGLFDSLLARGNRLRTEAYSRASLAKAIPETAPATHPVFLQKPAIQTGPVAPTPVVPGGNHRPVTAPIKAPAKKSSAKDSLKS
jgi:hypothetical protein